jgi:hypothetical protein
MVNNKGIAIFISLMLLFLLSAAIIAVLLTAYNYNSICEGQISRLKAITSAEAGINYAYYQLRTNEATFVSDHKVPPGAVYAFPVSDPVMSGITNLEFWVEDLNPPIAGKYIIKSKATYRKSSMP